MFIINIATPNSEATYRYLISLKKRDLRRGLGRLSGTLPGGRLQPGSRSRWGTQHERFAGTPILQPEDTTGSGCGWLVFGRDPDYQLCQWKEFLKFVEDANFWFGASAVGRCQESLFGRVFVLATWRSMKKKIENLAQQTKSKRKTPDVEPMLQQLTLVFCGPRRINTKPLTVVFSSFSDSKYGQTYCSMAFYGARFPDMGGTDKSVLWGLWRIWVRVVVVFFESSCPHGAFLRMTQAASARSAVTGQQHDLLEALSQFRDRGVHTVDTFLMATPGRQIMDFMARYVQHLQRQENNWAKVHQRKLSEIWLYL